MTGRGHVDVVGAARLATTLRTAAHRIGKLDRANNTVGHSIRERATTRAPRRTGRLAASIRVTRRPDGVDVRAGAPYAAFVEYGTRRMRAQPFMRPAVGDDGDEWLPHYQHQVEEILNTVRGA